MSTTLVERAIPLKDWPDERLVQECLNGKEEAWCALVDKFKNLVYSIPLKYGLTPEDSADIFQSVLLETVSQLHTLREPRALPKWLMQVAAHKSYHFKKRQARSVSLDDEEKPLPEPVALPPDFERILHETQEEQALREAIAGLQPRCAQLVQMLFFDQPVVAYEEAARRLGIATGSIGFIRGRCLKLLRRRLEAAGQ